MPRETAVTIRMSFEEKEALKAIAKTEGLSLSEFLRDVALGTRTEKPAIPSETQHDQANKAKVRKAVENEEPYEVKVEPSSLEEADKRIEDDLAAKDAFLAMRIPELKNRMSSRNAEAAARKEWEEAHG